MKTGKLNNDDLKRIVLERLPVCSTEVSKGPATGLDCAILKSREGLMVISSDPITGAANDVGRIAIHVSCNDIACCGIKPTAIMLVIIAPKSATEDELINIIDQASDAARKLGVDIVGGHTEVSDSVNRFVLITTAFGFTDNATVVKSSGAKVGDSILMTKYAGLEGTAILAADFGDRLSGLINSEVLQKAKTLIENISVVDEGVLCGSLKVNAMHDATEGGIMGGVWEMAEAGDVGCSIDLAKISVLPETKAICDAFELDPYKLISSGCMLISTERAEDVIETLKANNIFCTEIGKIVEKNRTYYDLNGQINELSPPQADELYKII